MNDDTQIQDDDAYEQSRALSLQDERPPAEISGYTPERRLGTGAYGTVWLAREDRTGRRVAIKFYPRKHSLNWSLLHREVEKLAALYTSHHIVKLLDVGWDSDPPWFVMEFVENGSLSSHLMAGPLSVEEAVRLTREVCSALVDAHGAGVLHCDLKPDNVLLDAQRHARLCDFGQSRMSHEQSPALGTLFYMAPEQADLEAMPDARWDVYAVGAMLYLMLTGEPPHRTESLLEALDEADSLAERLQVYRRKLAEQSAPTVHRSVKGVDARLADLIDRCLAEDPADRFANAQAVLDALDSRDRHRARRPLLLLGVAGPILLMAAMLPLFLSALRDNVNITEQRLTARALESDALSARLQAAALQDELINRLDELEEVLESPETTRLLSDLMQQPPEDVIAQSRSLHNSDPQDRPRWMQVLDAEWQKSTTSNRERGRGVDTSWFLTDAAGNQLWRRNFNDDTVGRNYAWRDYFHGRNREFAPGELPEGLRPISEPHVSLPFRSEATNRFMVAFSVPVRHDDGTVIGVFARTVHLGDLQARLGSRMQSTSEGRVKRLIALADSRNGQLLDHEWMTADALRADQGEETRILAALRIPETRFAEIRTTLGLGNSDSSDSRRPSNDAASDIRLADYQDPVGALGLPGTEAYAGLWMAAMTATSAVDTPWVVIVQEDRAAALQPVADMAAQARHQAWTAVVIAFLLMGIIWAFVIRAITRPVLLPS